ncbi:MAG: glycosyltransferase family 9 protein [Leptospirales bacterium]
MKKKLQPFRFSSDLLKSPPSILYFLSGQGLGDVIFGNRLLLFLRGCLPDWKIVIFYSTEWKDISVAEELGATVVWYPSIQEFPDRYKWGIKFLENQKSQNRNVYFLRWDSLDLPDRYSLRETVFESMSRGVGLVLKDCDRRGYVPFSKTASMKADAFLKDKNLEKGGYYVFGPHTGQHKNWGIQNYEKLGKKLTNKFGLRCIVVGVKSDPVPDIPDRVDLLSAPLDVVKEVISRATFFVGNDSGITHMAGCCDIPVYEVFAKARLEPLIEWRTLSPFSRYVIEPAMGDENRISVDTLFYLIEKDFESFRKQKEIFYYFCPACQRKMEYVVGAESFSIDFMCACGGILRVLSNDNAEILSEKEISKVDHFQVLLSSSLSEIDSFSKDLKNGKYKELNVRMEIPNPYKPKFLLRKASSANSSSSFFWSLDSALLFFKRYDYTPTRIVSVKSKNSELYNDVDISLSLKGHGQSLTIPWGGGEGLCLKSEIYFTYFCWNTFGNLYRSIKIPKSIYLYEKKKRMMFFAALFVFTAFKGKASGIMFLKTCFLILRSIVKL